MSAVDELEALWAPFTKALSKGWSGAFVNVHCSNWWRIASSGLKPNVSRSVTMHEFRMSSFFVSTPALYSSDLFISTNQLSQV